MPIVREKQLLYVLGMPGAGKSTLVQAALAGVPAVPVVRGEIKYQRYPGGIQLGDVHENPRLRGTDALHLCVQPGLIRWLATCPYTAVLAEGDRLAYDGFFWAMAQQGWHLTLAWLDCPPAEAARRRQQRGTTQQASWVRGRQTKVQRLVTQWQTACWRLDATQAIDTLAAELRQHPVLGALRRAP